MSKTSKTTKTIKTVKTAKTTKRSTTDDLAKLAEEIQKDPFAYANSISTDKLSDVLRELSHYYYNTNNPLVADDVFDLLKGVLEDKDPSNAFLFEIGAPISKEKVELPFPMSSLNKIKDSESITAFIKKYPGPYVKSLKLDGIAGLLHKIDDKFKFYTRGDGLYGQDITHLVPYLLKGKVDPAKIPNNTAIKGEIIMSKKNFETIKDQFKNARNVVAGLVNSKTVPVDVAKLTDFIGHGLLHPLYKAEVQMKKLEEWGFPVVEYEIKNSLSHDLLSKQLPKARETSKYEIDGFVIIDSSKVYDISHENPAYGFAFKMVLADQTANVKVLDVVWNITMHGYLKPTIKIVPTSLVGVVITNVTAFNGKFVVDNKLGPGSMIKLVRSGDVIPHILEVLTPSSTGKPKMPDVPYEWNDSGVDLVVKDVHGAAKDAIIIRQITHFFKTMDIKYISEGIITKLVEHGYKSVKDILSADMKDLAKIDGVGEKLVSKIFDNTMYAFENTNLETLMAASNVFGRGFGVRKNKVIVAKYPNIMNENWDTKELFDKIMLLDGFDVKTAKQFSANFSKFKQFFQGLESVKLISVKQLKQPPKVGKVTALGVFKDMKIVFTGIRDKELAAYIIANGGSIGDDVNKKDKDNTLLIHRDDYTTSSSYIKAKELGIETISISDFKKKYGL